MIRRLVLYSLLAVGLYYGYGVLYRASATAPELRGRAAQNADSSDPLGTAVQRRANDERAVQQTSGQPPESQPRE